MLALRGTRHLFLSINARKVIDSVRAKYQASIDAEEASADLFKEEPDDEFISEPVVEPEPVDDVEAFALMARVNPNILRSRANRTSPKRKLSRRI
ncbi:unnamed protein product [Phytophthora lilii]|uniref:Unnamed protein product n=1 Tax=Phytophthora lilii TaxID=2077276 RepID=A0A9W6YFT4_9STRA|nr:unnamed protein product [Phytophthora lilii]